MARKGWKEQGERTGRERVGRGDEGKKRGSEVGRRLMLQSEDWKGKIGGGGRERGKEKREIERKQYIREGCRKRDGSGKKENRGRGRSQEETKKEGKKIGREKENN